MDEDLVNLAENSLNRAEEVFEFSQDEQKNMNKAEDVLEITQNDQNSQKICALERELDEAGKKIVAKHFAVIRGMNKSGGMEDLAYCILLFFDIDVPRAFFWEPVSKFFANPSPLLQRIRLSQQTARNRKIGDSVVREMIKRLKNIDKSEVESHKYSKEIKPFIEFLEKFVEFFSCLWPGCLVEPEGSKKKFKIPMTKKNVEETELNKKINQEKRLLQELRYQERKLKWDEERNVKKEFKQEQLRDMQREINYSKNIEDEYKKMQEFVKKGNKK